MRFCSPDKLPLKGALSLLFFTLMVSWLPIKDAYQPGGDEGCELLKSFMYSSGFARYRDMWNDQPPLHTMILGAVFQVAGPRLPAARVLAIGFGSLLLYSLMGAVWMRCGRAAALAAGLILSTSAMFLDLSFSVMLEVPAFATAMLAVWLLFRWLEGRYLAWLVLSGLITGCALQMKLTAALIMPAAAAELILNGPAASWHARCRSTIKAMLLWLGALAVAFGAIAIISRESFGPMWESHTHSVSGPGRAVIGLHELRFSLSELSNHLESLTPAVLGLLATAWRRHWRRMLFPLVVLATCLIVHLLHRPYWYYYQLHFVIPMAWIGGYGFAESLAGLRAAIAAGVRKARPDVLWFAWLGICAAVICVLEGGPQLSWHLDSLGALPKVSDDPLVQKLRENAKATRWVYSDEYVYPFLARLPVPPELVVMPRKRFWSGQLTGDGILRYVRRYQPEQVLLSAGSKMSSEWERTDATNYSVVYEDGEYRLFVAKRIGPRRAGSAMPGEGAER